MAVKEISSPAMQRSGFEYHSLHHNQKQIRLLRFEGDESSLDDELTLSFTVDILSLADIDHARYIAISYAWGDNPGQAEILLNGSSVTVAGSAERALRAILSGVRQTEMDIRCLIWIDAICIQQANLEEKSHQVAMMGKIYAEAASVVIWLGSDDDGSTAAALKAMRLLQHDRAALGISEDELLQKPFTRSWYADDHQLPYWSNPPPHGVDWKAIDTFLRARWFSRLWIVQELAHAREVVCFRGRLLIPWELLMPVIHWIRLRKFPECVSTIGDFEARLESINRLMQLRENPEEERSFDFLLFLNVHFNAGNPCDRVYALLGLRKSRQVAELEAVPNGKVEVDYERPLGDLYAQATYVSMLVSQSLDPLQFLPVTAFRVREEGIWPSWVPSYDKLAEDVRNGEYIYDLFSRRMVISVLMQLDGYSPSGNVLHVKGICLGQVDSVFDFGQLQEIPSESSDEVFYRRQAQSWLPKGPGVDTGLEKCVESLAVSLQSRAKTDLLLRGKPWRVMDLAAFLLKVAEEAQWCRLSDIQQALALAGAHEGNSEDLMVSFRSITDTLGLFSIVRLSQGSIGFCAGDIRIGDEICTLFSADYAIVLRSAGESKRICGFVGFPDFEHVSTKLITLAGCRCVLTFRNRINMNITFGIKHAWQPKPAPSTSAEGQAGDECLSAV